MSRYDVVRLPPPPRLRRKLLHLIQCLKDSLYRYRVPLAFTWKSYDLLSSLLLSSCQRIELVTHSKNSCPLKTERMIHLLLLLTNLLIIILPHWIDCHIFKKPGGFNTSVCSFVIHRSNRNERQARFIDCRRSIL